MLSLQDSGITTHSPLVRMSPLIEFVTEAPVKSCHSGDTTLSVRPTIQSEPVHCQEDGVLLCLCTNLGQASWGEGKHQYGIHSEV